MGEETNQKDVYHHLHEALEADEISEKDFHIRQAQQLLGIRQMEQ